MTIHPREVFEYPQTYWRFLTTQQDVDCEGQHFDRKEAGRRNLNGCVDRNTVKFFDCQNDSGSPDKICLIYVPYTEHSICETIGSVPRAMCSDPIKLETVWTTTFNGRLLLPSCFKLSRSEVV